MVHDQILRWRLPTSKSATAQRNSAQPILCEPTIFGPSAASPTQLMYSKSMDRHHAVFIVSRHACTAVVV